MRLEICVRDLHSHPFYGAYYDGQSLKTLRGFGGILQPEIFGKLEFRKGRNFMRSDIELRENYLVY